MHALRLLGCLMLVITLTNPLSGQKKNSAQKNTADTCTGKGVAIQSLGASTNVVLYNTFLAIGSIVDGHVRGVYEDELTLGLLDEQLRMINMVDTSYAKLLQSGFVSGAEDKKFLESARVVLSNLYVYANSYKVYVGDKSEAHKKEFDAAQTNAATGLSEFLGL